MLTWGLLLPSCDDSFAGHGSRSPEGEAVGASELVAGSCWAFTKLASTRAASSLLGAILRRKAVCAAPEHAEAAGTALSLWPKDSCRKCGSMNVLLWNDVTE